MPKISVVLCTLLLLAAAACGASSDVGPGDAARVDVSSAADDVAPIEAVVVGDTESENAESQDTESENAESQDTESENAESETTTTIAVPDPTAEQPLLLSPFGLSFIQPDQSLRTLGQGTSPDELLAALESVLGPRPDETLIPTECGRAFTSWPGLINVSFGNEDGLFLSWSLPDGSPLVDASGIGLGSSRSDLDTAWITTFFDEELWGVQFLVEGNEEFVDGMGGLLDGSGEDAVITSLWGGTPCIAS